MTINAATGAWLYNTSTTILRRPRRSTRAITVTQTYTATVTDANGATDNADGHDHHHGTNDAPVISSEAGAGAVTEAGLAEETTPRR